MLNVRYLFLGPIRKKDLFLGLSARFIKLASEIIKVGGNVIIVNSYPINVSDSKDIKQYCNERKIEYIDFNNNKLGKISLFFKLYKYMPILFSNYKIDVVWVFQPALQHLALYLRYFKKKDDIKFILDWAENYWDYLSIDKLLYSPLSFVSRVIQLKLSHVITITNFELMNQINKHGCKKELVWIPNGVDVDIYSPYINGKKIREKLALSGFILLRIGSYSKCPIDEILIPFSELIKKMPDVYLVSIGGSVDDIMRARKLVSDSKLERHIIVGDRVDDSDLPYYVAASDASLTNYSQSQISMPTKTLIFMSMNCPIITTKFRGINSVLTENRCIFIDDISQLDDAITWCRENPDDIKKITENARHQVVNIFAWQSIVKKFLGISFS